MISLLTSLSVTRNFAWRARRVRMPLAPHSQSNDITRAFCTKVGDVVPVSFMKEVPDPVIKENDDYPEWVFSLGDKSAGRNMSKAQLLKKIEEDGLESLTAEQMMRAKRLLTLEKIKDNNVAGR